MKYAYLVALREYIESTKAKGFWIGILIMPVIIFLSIQAPVFLEEKATPIRYWVLVDQSGTFAPVIQSALDHAHQKRVLQSLRDYAAKYTDHRASSAEATRATRFLAEFNDDHPQALDTFIRKGGKDFFLEQLRPGLKPGAPPFQDPRRLFHEVPLPSGISPAQDIPALAADLKPYLRAEKKFDLHGQQAGLYAAILIPPDIETSIARPAPFDHASRITNHVSIQFWSTDVSASKDGSGLAGEIERAINAEVRRREYLARGMDSEAVAQVERTSAPFASLNPKKEAGKEAVNTTDVIRQWAPSAFVYLLWLAIFAIVQMLLNNTIEEKSNRIIEVLLSSVTPGELMMGKLFGIAAVGLTMVGAWMLALFGVLSWKAGGASMISGQILGVLKGSNLILLFSIYFLLGYLMYAGLILSIGSVCNTIKEAQSYMAVLTMLMMVPLLTMTFIPKDPNGTLARVLSWIPIYTPFRPAIV